MDTNTQLDPADGGYASRKFIMCLASVGIMFLGCLIAAKIPAVAAVYSSFVGGVVGVVVAYLTGNVAAKLAIGKVNNAADATTDTTEQQS